MRHPYSRNLAFVLAALFGCLLASRAGAADVPAERVMAIYFHRTERCPTCLKMGSYSEEAIQAKFARQIKDGSVAFHFVDFQEPRNAAVAKGYGIDAPALIVAKIANNKVVKFTNLEEIWTNVADKASFVSYVQQHVAAHLAPRDRVVAMYFHRTQRCPTCLKMGGYLEEAIKHGFAQQAQDGTVGFHQIDFQDAANAALVKQYGIGAPTLIIAKVVDGKVVDSKNLADIWTKVADKQSFLAYVQQNITAYRQADSGSRNSHQTAETRAR